MIKYVIPVLTGEMLIKRALVRIIDAVDVSLHGVIRRRNSESEFCGETDCARFTVNGLVNQLFRLATLHRSLIKYASHEAAFYIMLQVDYIGATSE